MSKFQLMSALFGKGCDNARVAVNGIEGILQSVQRESGSGNSFVLVISTDDGQYVKEYVRTSD